MATTATETTPVSRESVHSEYFDAPILAIRTSQATVDRELANLQPTQTTALAANQPPIDSADGVERQPSVGVGVGRVRSLLRKKRPAEAQDTTPAAAASQPAATPAPTVAPASGPAASLRGSTTPPSAAPKSALASTPAKPASVVVAPGPAVHEPSTDDERSPAAGTVADGVLSRDYIARAPSRTSKRASVRSSSVHPSSVHASSVRAPSRTSKRASVRAPSRASKASKASRPQSRASTVGTSEYNTASGSERTESEAGESDEEPASFFSPVARSRSSRASRHTRRSSAPPSRRDLVDLVPSGGGVRHERAKSVSGRSSRTARQSMIANGGVFGRGAGTIGPGALPEPEESAVFHERGVAATSGLSQKQVKRIGKEELREGKRLAKVLRHEGKLERKALEVAVNELAELQAMQKKAIKEESRAHTAHAKALKVQHAAELVFLDAQRRLQLAQAELRAKETSLDASRDHAASVTERVQDKNREVELLRAQKGADSREREAKVRQLTGKA